MPNIQSSNNAQSLQIHPLSLPESKDRLREQVDAPSHCPALTAPHLEAGDFPISDLCAFAIIPPHHDVVPLLGEVAVFDPGAWRREGLISGAFYVVDNQLPANGLDWATYDRLNSTRGPHTRLLIKTRRSVMRMVQDERDLSQWWYVHPLGFRDGPLHDSTAGLKVIGKVVGIFRPACANQ